tara:strand:+ start:107 stop:958 length:852 start_codon:yes stop_codon:yes gene_type:complete
MPISRMQMPRQLRRGGGIMNVAPRQGYFLGGVGDALKGVVKGVTGGIKSAAKGIVSTIKDNPALALAALNFAPMLGGGAPFIGFGKGKFAGSLASIPGFSALAGEKTLGKTLGVVAGGTVLGGVLGAMSPEEQEEVSSGRNIEALRGKLTTAYQNLGYDESKIPALVENDLSEYTSGAGGYANGGRIGYAMGTDQIVNQASGIMGLPQRTNKAGVKELDLRESGGFIPPVGVKEKADDIPAMLSNNEFVFTADAVRGMGNGNVNKGAQRMYDIMKKLEKGGRV